MTVLVHFSGPSFSKSVVLQAGAAPLEVGRDAQAPVHLPDHDRLISRRHCKLEWDAAGIKVTVLSKVNGISTPRGEFGLGQTVVLAPGEAAHLGRYTFVAAPAGAVTPAAAPPVAPPADDPFHLFATPAAAAAPASVFDDPFFRQARASGPATADLAAALAAMGGTPAPGARHFSGAAPALPADPLAAFGGAQAPVHSSASIDDFLGAGSSQPRGLGAAHMLKFDPADARRLATDHVHDFNLPLGALAPAPAPPTPPAAPSAPLGGDPLAALDAFASQPMPVAPPAGRPADKAADPWSEFASDWVPAGAAPRKPAPVQPPNDPLHNRAFDDAFSSSTAWHIDDGAATPPLEALVNEEEAIDSAFAMPEEPAGGSDAGALAALCEGLGINGPTQLSPGQWQQLGRSMRQIVQGLADLMTVRSELKRELRAADRTMLGAQENNPLKSGIPLDELLHYLLFMGKGAAGYMPAQRALDESIADLRAHEFASLKAVRSAVEGAIREFDPARLRATLLKGRMSIGSLVDNARLWDLYAAHYHDKGEHMADWLEQVFNRHYMPAYLRESERLRRETLPQPPDRRS